MLANSAAEWQARFTLQARWSAAARAYVYTQTGLAECSSILEIGCGPGVLLPEYHRLTRAQITGLDLQRDFLALARQVAPFSHLVTADAAQPPFGTAVFDACICHYVMLWLPDPFIVLRQVFRVLRPGGLFLALAEPDYGGRLDYPPILAQLGSLQTAALRHQGADPFIGRSLAALLLQADFQAVTSGVIGGQWQADDSSLEVESEWQMLRQDLHNQLDEDTINQLFNTYLQTRQSGERILYVPTFYAWGRKPNR